MDLDEYQKQLGGITRYQVFVILAASYLTFGTSYMSQSAVYLSAVPEHRCSVPPIDQFNISEAEILNLTIPYENNEYSTCERYAYNLSLCEGEADLPGCLTAQGSMEEVGTIPCDQGYHFAQDVFLETTISEWSLVCDRRYLDSLANTLFFLGFFLGSSYIGPLTDWFGRLNAMRLMCVGIVCAGVAVSFMTNFAAYVTLRVVTAAFYIPCFISVFTYANELSTVEWRTETAAWINMLTGMTHTIFPWICKGLQEWRYIHFIISIAGIPFLLITLFLPESPRWLASKGKYKELRKVLNRYAESAGQTLDDETFQKIEKNAEATRMAAENSAVNENKIAFWDLYRRPIMRILSFNTLFCWFTVAMVFYGLALNGGNLSGDFYLNNTLNACVEIVGYALIYFAGPIGRRPMLSAGYLLGGIFCISSMLSDLLGEGAAYDTMATVFAISGKLFATMAFGLVYAVTSEIYPTSARATAISMGSMAARVGSMLSPFILQVNDTIPWFTQTVFGALSIIAGLMTFIYPETSKIGYIGSLDEAESFYRKNITVLKYLGCGGLTKDVESSDEEEYKEKHSYDNKIEISQL